MRCAARSLLVLLAAALCACGGHGPVPILTYHGIGPGSDPFTVTAENLAAHLDALEEDGFTTITLRELLDADEKGQPLPLRPIVLTFDDALAEHYDVVLPLLRERGMRGTFFLISSFLGPDADHRISPASWPGSRFLVWTEVRQMHAQGMEIGSHTVTHPRLPSLSDADASDEISRSRQELEAGLGEPIETFAYPYNSLRKGTRDLVRRAGYRLAVAGDAHGNLDRFSLYRVGVYHSTTVADLRARLQSYETTAASN